MLTAMGWDGQEAPADIAASARWAGAAGDEVDAALAAMLTWADGTTMSFHVDFAGPERQRLELLGPTAAIEVPERHATPDQDDSGYLRRSRDGTVTRVPTASSATYASLVAHVRDVLVDGAPPLRPAARSVALAGLLDDIRDAAR
jgi:predicted dehydrogenase